MLVEQLLFYLIPADEGKARCGKPHGISQKCFSDPSDGSASKWPAALWIAPTRNTWPRARIIQVEWSNMGSDRLLVSCLFSCFLWPLISTKGSQRGVLGKLVGNRFALMKTFHE